MKPWKENWLVTFYDGPNPIEKKTRIGKNAPTVWAKNQAWALRRLTQGREVTWAIELIA